MQELILASLHAMQHLIENNVDAFLEAQMKEGYEGRDKEEIECLIENIKGARKIMNGIVEAITNSPMAKMLDPGDTIVDALMNGRLQVGTLHPGQVQQIQQAMEEQGYLGVPPIDPKKAN